MNIRLSEDQNESIRKSEVSENQKKNKPRHEKLWIWQKSHELRIEIFNICNKIPSSERFRLIDQVLRSSKSVADNIAEGNAAYYFNDKIKSFYVSRKEAGETQNHIREMQSKYYISSEYAERIISNYEEVIRGLNGMVRRVNLKRELYKSKGSSYL